MRITDNQHKDKWEKYRGNTGNIYLFDTLLTDDYKEKINELINNGDETK